MSGVHVSASSDAGRSEDGARALLSSARRLRAAAENLERQARQVGAPNGAAAHSWLDVLHGGWRVLRAAASERLERDEAETAAADDEIVIAITSGLLGEVDLGREAASRAELRSRTGGLPTVGGAIAHAAVWMARGEPTVATEVLLDAARRVEHDGTGRSRLVDLIGLLAESAARSGRLNEVGPVLDLARSSPAPGRTAHEELAFATALAAEDPLEALTALPGSGPVASAFVLGRVHLWAGMLQRRRQNPASARHHLQLALDHLGRCEAAPWIDIASNELRLAGVPVPRRSSLLTEQQLAIARLAAQGLSNRRIAEELYLSPRTVGSHLYRIFPKLGITSRHHLTVDLVEGG